MHPPTTATSTSMLIASRLFGGNRLKLTEWMEQTQARLEALTNSTATEPLPLPSLLNQCTNNPSTAFEPVLMQLCEQVASTGYALYQWSDKPIDTAQSVSQLLQTLSLSDSDKGVIQDAGELSLLQDLTGTPKGRFPPYQAKSMNWHTDGYYNDANQTIRCFSLHCVAPAAKGGALLLMDDVFLVYALLKEDPELVALLSHPDAMTLPQNKDNDGHDRPDRSVPVILRNADEMISMRFTTRTQNIRWRCNATRAAAQRASELINAHSEWHTRITLQTDQGIITRNVLHARETFVDTPDNPKRQMLRGRFTNLPTTVFHSNPIQSVRGI